MLRELEIVTPVTSDMTFIGQHRGIEVLRLANPRVTITSDPIASGDEQVTLGLTGASIYLVDSVRQLSSNILLDAAPEALKRICRSGMKGVNIPRLRSHYQPHQPRTPICRPSKQAAACSRALAINDDNIFS